MTKKEHVADAVTQAGRVCGTGQGQGGCCKQRSQPENTQVAFVRVAAAFTQTLVAGDRYVWYNPDGFAKLWTEAKGDLFTFDFKRQGRSYMGGRYPSS